MKRLIGKFLAAAAILEAAPVLAQEVELGELRQAFAHCRAMAETLPRLACYDGLVSKLEPPRFQGARAEETPAFSVEGPTVLRYQSDGPIFVMSLKDAQGNVVQNLHIGGGGEDSFLINRAGTYSLQISGTDTWRVWVEPRPAAAPHG